MLSVGFLSISLLSGSMPARAGRPSTTSVTVWSRRVDQAALARQRVAILVVDAEFDLVLQRHRRFSSPCSPARTLPARGADRHLVLAVRAAPRARAVGVVLVQDDGFEQVVDQVGLVRRRDGAQARRPAWRRSGRAARGRRVPPAAGAARRSPRPRPAGPAAGTSPGCPCGSGCSPGPRSAPAAAPCLRSVRAAHQVFARGRSAGSAASWLAPKLAASSSAPCIRPGFRTARSRRGCRRRSAGAPTTGGRLRAR